MPFARWHAPALIIGSLSRRTGVTAKALRHCADDGLIFTAGKNPRRHPLFDGSARRLVLFIGSLDTPLPFLYWHKAPYAR